MHPAPQQQLQQLFLIFLSGTGGVFLKCKAFNIAAAAKLIKPAQTMITSLP